MHWKWTKKQKLNVVKKSLKSLINFTPAKGWQFRSSLSVVDTLPNRESELHEEEPYIKKKIALVAVYREQTKLKN